MVQQGAGFANQLGKVRFHDTPYQVAFHIGVPVNQEVAEGDYSLEVGYPAGSSLV